MDETVYFNQNGIYVSKSQVIINGQMLRIDNVASLSFGTVKPKKRLPLFFILVGLPLLFNGVLFEIIGGYSILAGSTAWIIAKTNYTVTLNTKVGENKTLASKDRFHIEQLIFALHTAMVADNNLINESH
jgi:hypothetical protein